MPGVCVGGEAKLFYNGVVSIRDGRLAVPLCADVLIETMRAGPVVGIVCRVGNGRLCAFRQLLRGIEDRIIGRMVLGHVRAFRSRMSIR